MVGAGRHHLMYRVDAPKGSRLRTPLVERQLQRDRLAGSHESCSLLHLLGGDVVERPALITRPPAGPVTALRVETFEMRQRHLTAHRPENPERPSPVLAVLAASSDGARRNSSKRSCSGEHRCRLL